MKTVIVVDASVVISALCDNDPRSDRLRDRLASERLCAPELIYLETVSVLRRRAASGAITTSQAQVGIEALYHLPIVSLPHAALIDRIWQLRDNVTPYDAAYVATAELTNAPLLTGDARLAGAPGSRCAFEVY